METHPPSAVHTHRFIVPQSALDQNGHANNVMFVQWMQDLAVSHYESTGGRELTQSLGATWVVREHHVEYLLPAFAGEEIEARTWVTNIRRVRSLRKYRFVRRSDGKLLVRGETDWVFVDVKTQQPRRIPPEIEALFTLLPLDDPSGLE
jgi:acyl-CoA thioester hydrolase